MGSPTQKRGAKLPCGQSILRIQLPKATGTEHCTHRVFPVWAFASPADYIPVTTRRGSAGKMALVSRLAARTSSMAGDALPGTRKAGFAYPPQRALLITSRRPSTGTILHYIHPMRARRYHRRTGTRSARRCSLRGLLPGLPRAWAASRGTASTGENRAAMASGELDAPAIWPERRKVQASPNGRSAARRMAKGLPSSSILANCTWPNIHSAHRKRAKYCSLIEQHL